MITWPQLQNAGWETFVNHNWLYINMQHCGAKLGTFQLKPHVLCCFVGNLNEGFILFLISFSCWGELKGGTILGELYLLKFQTCVPGLLKNHQSQPYIYGFHLIDSLKAFELCVRIFIVCLVTVFSFSVLPVNFQILIITMSVLAGVLIIGIIVCCCCCCRKCDRNR